MLPSRTAKPARGLVVPTHAAAAAAGDLVRNKSAHMSPSDLAKSARGLVFSTRAAAAAARDLGRVNSADMSPLVLARSARGLVCPTRAAAAAARDPRSYVQLMIDSRSSYIHAGSQTAAGQSSSTTGAASACKTGGR